MNGTLPSSYYGYMGLSSLTSNYNDNPGKMCIRDRRIITRMSLKAIFDLLPKSILLRVNKSYIVNTDHIESFDNNDIFIKSYEIAIGNRCV